MRRWLAVLPASLVLASLAGPAPFGRARADSLYEGRAITTGTDLRERPGGFARALADVLAKVGADPALRDDPRVAALPAGAFVLDFAYIDRMAHLPRRDEQGSRDRPYDLLVRFDPARVNAALAGLGVAPWRGERPRLWVHVQVRGPRGEFPLTADGHPDEPQRAALLAAAERFGLPVALPPLDRVGEAAPPGTTPVWGVLEWHEAEAGWAGRWRLPHRGRDAEWEVRGVNFDAAFRDLVGGAARVLSGKAP